MKKKEITIHIGEFFASREPMVIHTLLGSCVAVCLYDPARRIGGMNHILLPGRADLTKFDVAARYGINAMELLINRIMELGGRRQGLMAKVFGGSHLFPAFSEEHGPGKKNTTFVLGFLNKEGIRIAGKDVGGDRPRKIFFHTDTGKVFLKRISSVDPGNIIARQESQAGRLRKKEMKWGDVTLFKNS